MATGKNVDQLAQEFSFSLSDSESDISGNETSESDTELDTYIMVASIDFGTTFSGYALSFKSDESQIIINKNWGQAVGFQSYKTPTSVLLDKRGKMLAFGYEAETKYNEMITSKGEDSCELYRHFKMALHNEKHLTRKTKIKSVRGKSARAMEIFTHAIKYLKDHLIEAVEKTTTTAPSPDMIRWVITVPAIWNEASKRFMREVAYEAGLTSDIDSRHFMVCLEPEAASIFCRELRPDEFAKDTASGTKLLTKCGAKYMIIDAGGGTIDITVQEIQRGGKVKEIVGASGGPWGGTMVDKNFIELLSQLMGQEFIQRYQAECPSEWLELSVNFERRKKTLTPTDSPSINIPLGWSIAGKYQEVTGKSLQKVLEKTPVQGVSFKNGNIIIDAELGKSLFSPVIDRIINHIQCEMKSPKLTGLSLMLLVGGFGECTLLQDALANAFSPKLAVVCPSEAGISIIKGAVLFGHNPDIISSRIARKTYGRDICTEFDEDEHPEERRETINGEDYCEIFETFVAKGESVGVGEVRSFTCVPIHDDATECTQILYSADVADVEYPDDQTVTEIGEITVSMPDTTDGSNREVLTKVYFGSTEIYVEATEVREDGQGDTANTTIDFLSE